MLETTMTVSSLLAQAADGAKTVNGNGSVLMLIVALTGVAAVVGVLFRLLPKAAGLLKRIGK